MPPHIQGEAVPAVRNCLESRLRILQIEGMSEVDVSNFRGRRDAQQLVQQPGKFAVRAVVSQQRAVRCCGNTDRACGRLGWRQVNVSYVYAPRPQMIQHPLSVLLAYRPQDASSQAKFREPTSGDGSAAAYFLMKLPGKGLLARKRQGFETAHHQV